MVVAPKNSRETALHLEGKKKRQRETRGENNTVRIWRALIGRKTPPFDLEISHWLRTTFLKKFKFQILCIFFCQFFFPNP